MYTRRNKDVRVGDVSPRFGRFLVNSRKSGLHNEIGRRRNGIYDTLQTGRCENDSLRKRRQRPRDTKEDALFPFFIREDVRT